MWPNYYYLEARRLAAERSREAEAAALARAATLYRSSHEPAASSGRLRRSAARVAVAVGRQSLRLARALDGCVADAGGAPSAMEG